MSLHAMIERAARLNPEGVATRCNGRTVLWRELADRVGCLASALQFIGLAEGERTAILSLNSDRYYESIFAITWASGCVVPLNTRWALPENKYALGDGACRILLFDDAFTDQAERLLAELDCLESAIYMGDGECPGWARSYEELISANDPIAASTRSGDDMAGIFYTGGTTGFPKGVMLSHGALYSSALGTLSQFAMARESNYLHAAPMFHIADFAASMGATLSCACNTILPAFEPGRVLQILEEEGVTHTLIVPSMIKMLLSHPDADSFDLAGVDRVIYGASPMPQATLEQFMALWPHIGLVQAYGQTELAPVATLLSVEDHLRGGKLLRSAGRPIPVSDLRIVGEDGRDCPQGSTGEVAVRGPHTMLGYWNNPEETALALQDGWVFTGDAGVLDEQGYLYIVDRVKDMVVTGGENVFTTEVENAAITHEAVLDVAVIGIPHEEWGEAVHAIVLLHPDQRVTEEDLITHCRQQIAGYKVPKSISFRTEPMPLSGAGKVLKTELRKPWWKGLDRQVN
ncbi:MAG: AMP-binding protein [Halioglobus sp.]